VNGRFAWETRGQSLVEIALAFPILLLLVLGIADLGRFAAYSLAVTHAARDAAEYAAKNPSIGADEVKTRVCVDMKLAAECDTGLENPTLLRTASGTTVTVKYQFTLITAAIANRLGAGSIGITSTATFPGYTQ
jgi:Flp pilus assembly protein TadG